MGGRVASPTFVGRTEELQALEAARRRAADGEPAVVLVGGEAGIGKTRLIAELTTRCATDGTRVLAGGCVPVGDGVLPYAPFVEALRSLPAELGVDAVRELVGPSWPELARLLPALGEPEVGPTGQAAQARLFELLLGLLTRLSEQTPVALVVEDLHWADQSTRDLLAFLVRNLRRNHVLLVVTYRNDEPGQQRLGPYLAELDRGGPVQRLELPRLNRAETAAQLVGILGAVPAEDLVDGVFGRSEGNPFFTEELLAVVRSGSRQLPATLRDLLRGRVDALPEPAQQVLAVAAVASRRVPHRLLASRGRPGRPAARPGVEDRRRQPAAGHQAGEDGYHVPTRPVAGGDRRRPAPRRTDPPACPRPTPSPTCSTPVSRAGQPQRPRSLCTGTARNLPKALEWSVRAAIEADGMHAYAEALGHYERVLELWDRVADSEERAGIDHAELLQLAAQDARNSGTATMR